MSFDDSVYGASIIDMRHGLVPYRDLFASQGPLFFPLLFVGDLIGLRTLNGARVVPVLAGIIAAIGIWATARRLGATPATSLVAGLMVASSGSMLWTTGPATADGPAAAFTVCALFVAAGCRARSTLGKAAACGALLGAALATKPLMFAAIVPIMMWVAPDRAWRHRAILLCTAAFVWFSSALPFGLSNVWSQSIAFHLDKQVESSPIANVGFVARTLFNRDLLLVAAVVLGGIAYLSSRSRAVKSRVTRADTAIIAIWLALVVLILTFEKLLLINHVATLVLPIALLFAARPPPLRWLAIAALILVPIQALQLSNIIVPTGYDGATEQVVDRLESLPSHAEVVSDIPGLAWQAGRITPRLLNDPSNARIETHRLTTATVVGAAARRATCAVVIWSFRFGRDLPGLRAALLAEHYRLVENTAPDHQLWDKSNCHPDDSHSHGHVPLNTRLGRRAR